jgi:cytochrome c nitrite reductase small subunit
MKPHVVINVLAVLIGLIVGLGGYTFFYAKGYSYLASDPAACANCHVMRGYYDGWAKSTHHAAATCNDCHTPANPAAKLATKTANGFFHSFAFTSGRFPDAIQIKSRNYEVTESACRQCHQNLVQVVNGPHQHGAGLSCIHCHASVGHSEAMAFAPIALVEGKN